MGKRLISIREEREINIKSRIKCKCGGDMQLSSKISIRSLLFSLRKIHAISEDELNNLDNDWKKYQRKNKLNAYHEPTKAITKGSCPRI